MPWRGKVVELKEEKNPTQIISTLSCDIELNTFTLEECATGMKEAEMCNEIILGLEILIMIAASLLKGDWNVQHL